MFGEQSPSWTEDNAYAKLWGDNQKALWYVMVFSGVVNWVLLSIEINIFHGKRICEYWICGWEVEYWFCDVSLISFKKRESKVKKSSHSQN